MRRAALLCLLSACFPAPPAADTAPAEVPTTVAETPATSLRYVLASRLNLRDAVDGKKVGRLPVNAPVVTLETSGEHSRVRVMNGKEGWVPTAFLSTTPMSIQSALQAARDATDPKERLAWTQRASALDFRSRDALTALEAAYREVGDARTADKVKLQLTWPSDILLAGTHWAETPGELALEWSTLPYDQNPADGGERDLDDRALRREGLTVGQTVWVLPNEGLAVRGTLRAARSELFNECGATWGITLQVQAALPEGTHAIAYTIATPPASWMQPGPVRDLEAAKAAVTAHLGPTPAPLTLHAAPHGDGVRVRAAMDVVNPDEDMSNYTLIDLQVHGDGRVEELFRREGYLSYVGYAYPTAGRDLDNDGSLDLFYEGQCAMYVQDAQGTTRMATALTCCGC